MTRSVTSFSARSNVTMATSAARRTRSGYPAARCTGGSSSMASKPRLAHETGVLLLALLTGLTGTTAAILLLIYGNFSSDAVWMLSVVLILTWVGGAFALRA